MREAVKAHVAFFESQTDACCLKEYANGLTGVGILKKPKMHLKHPNTVWIYELGFDTKGTKIEVHNDLYMTVNELADLQKCINQILKWEGMK